MAQVDEQVLSRAVSMQFERVTAGGPQENETRLSVTQALTLAKNALESVTLKIVGEVSDLNKAAGYKAVYFDFKDEKSTMKCLIWRTRYDALGVPIAIGSKLELTGRFSVYPVRGTMQFEVFTYRLAGEGDLRVKVANLARKLQDEGLTDSARKLPLPEYPLRLGLVTSPRGDAVHDVLRTLRRRWPLAEIVFAGVPVEGPDAPAGMANALRAVATQGVDAILLVRGGGSFEDLMPFNDENLCRCIAALPVPVVTGIGHEPDTTIADLVADLRASTPTAAAERVAPKADELAASLQATQTHLTTNLRQQVNFLNARLDAYAKKPYFLHPEELFDREEATLCGYHDLLLSLGRRLVAPFENEIIVAAHRLDDLSPLRVLARGYSIVRDEQGVIVDSVDTLSPDKVLQADFRDGVAKCRVTSCEKRR